ncbi:MAG: phosphate signaling complex protein PhoU [Chloroflexi bacterium]|nr:phosphate signaling complex protein PhoU [Chloroflexota bacterium]
MWRGRASFDRALGGLHDEVLVLGSMVDKALERSIEALRRLDQQAARDIIHNDLTINQKRFEIEEQAIELIATQQPLARDLRTIVAVLHIIVELERIGDYAEGIAKIALLHGDQPLLKPLIDVPRMADKARDMLRRSLSAFIEHDAQAAKQIAAEDDEVDALYDQVYRELLTYMLNDPRTIDRATWLLWVAHNLERSADRVTNICERVVYEVTGRMEEMNVSKY